MTVINGQRIGEHVLVDKAELEHLISLANQVEEIKLDLFDDDLPTQGLMMLAQDGGAFDWLKDEDDLYTIDDLKVRYR